MDGSNQFSSSENPLISPYISIFQNAKSHLIKDDIHYILSIYFKNSESDKWLDQDNVCSESENWWDSITEPRKSSENGSTDVCIGISFVKQWVITMLYWNCNQYPHSSVCPRRSFNLQNFHEYLIFSYC